MNLKELKAMIAEEYSNYLAEQAATPAPGVVATDADVDVTGGGDEDAEKTLRDIYDMLKDYFEGDDAAMGMEPPADDTDADDADEDTPEDEALEEKKDKDKENLQERFKKLANIIKG